MEPCHQMLSKGNKVKACFKHFRSNLFLMPEEILLFRVNSSSFTNFLFYDAGPSIYSLDCALMFTCSVLKVFRNFQMVVRRFLPLRGNADGSSCRLFQLFVVHLSKNDKSLESISDWCQQKAKQTFTEKVAGLHPSVRCTWKKLNVYSRQRHENELASTCSCMWDCALMECLHSGNTWQVLRSLNQS